MFKEIKNVIYKKKSMLSIPEYFQLEIDDDRKTLKYSDSLYSDSRKKLKIMNVDDEVVMEYFDKLFRIIDGWENKYENDNVLDGMEWQLVITYKNGDRKHYYGKNDSPINFEYLDKIKYEIINKMLESER